MRVYEMPEGITALLEQSITLVCPDQSALKIDAKNAGIELELCNTVEEGETTQAEALLRKLGKVLLYADMILAGFKGEMPDDMPKLNDLERALARFCFFATFNFNELFMMAGALNEKHNAQGYSTIIKNSIAAIIEVLEATKGANS